MALKSISFLTESIDLDEVQEDVEHLQELTPSNRRALAAFLSDGETLTLNEDAFRETLTAFLRSHDISATAFAASRRLLQFIIQCRMRGDAPEVLLEDLAEKVPIGARGSADFSVYDFVEATLPAIRRSSEFAICDAAVRRGLPFLSGVTYTCDARMVADPDFTPMRDRSETYSPAPMAWVPVAIVNFTTDEETELYFQVDLRRLDVVLDVLLAIKKDLECAHNSLRDHGLPVRHL